MHPYTSNPHVVKNPGNDVLGSRLEILDIARWKPPGDHEGPGRFEAPNWMPDEKNYSFNQGGSLYTIPI